MSGFGGGGPPADDGPRTVQRMLSDVRGLCLSTEDYNKFVLKLLRVGSARNAALEMKHDSYIAAVRLLQFALTASNLCYAVMRAVELAELAKLITGDVPDKEDEVAEAGGSGEKREVARELSLKSQEAHALVLARIPSEARCMIKRRHIGGVKELTWAADGATSSGPPVISGSRVIARWSATATGRSAPGLTTGSARRPSFGVGELARPLHTLVDPRMSTACRLLCERRSREDLDGQPVCLWTDHIAPLFNDPHFKPDRINELSNGVTTSDIATADPRT
jgi:hypothetical protein